MSLLRRLGWGPRHDSRIRTFPTGLLVDPLNLTPADVHLEDVAHSLARVNRFNGHTRDAYSVAQHAVICSRILQALSEPLAVAQAALYALHHDDGEAYLGDMPSPLKHAPMMAGYRRASEAAQAACYRAFGLDPTAVPASVHDIDRRMLRGEQLLFTLSPIPWAEVAADGCLAFLDDGQTWSSRAAERAFLTRHEELLRAVRLEADTLASTTLGPGIWPRPTGPTRVPEMRIR